jgi:hypothetical protein
MSGSEDILMSIVEQVQDRLKRFYYDKATENGIGLAKTIEADGDIQIPESNDPNLNEELVDERQGEGQTKS